ncbi:uncharacterized protein Z519_05603 [Cladophialophora bantiana CBS 173.52]|uniref:Uncharacterized protein n=1 Tax=Cladophialophora bantiana (strain ATCC 10958 / CBS 173.52 / CDC B-1940 / NIH 8579) TaxID=1442370 RepID=A0A0D2G6P5_CLAB1|nr:uncharacterized protein Z519_05603 [Cladophialophora bantiana CBS 173.52]KIW94287.1 hypothetical protein Z519_05603 [Cladophialophora bantiana CBS 173.52]
MSTVLGSPRPPSSQPTSATNGEPTPFEVLIAIGNILTWLLAVYVVYLHIQARWDLDARYRAHVEAERQTWSEAEKYWRDPSPAEDRGQEQRLQQILEEVEGDQDWEDEMLEWHGEIEGPTARKVETDIIGEIEEGMEVMEIPGQEEFERDYGRLCRW